ncbi:IS5/IS1182 family transposase, partial [Staphylococcus sp. SQ8-PEA]|nr:IS5/IS1182 family transposase [Staphylococcus marylandisciuri]
RKVVAQRANYSQNNSKKGNFCIITIEIALFSLIKDLYVPASSSSFITLLCHSHSMVLGGLDVTSYTTRLT